MQLFKNLFSSLLIAVVAMLAIAVSASAATTHIGRCTETDGRQFRVTYTLDGTLVQAKKLESRADAYSTWSLYQDSATDFSKLEWWTDRTYRQLTGLDPQKLSPAGFSWPWVTLVYNETNYATWWQAADGANILLQPVDVSLNPRIEFRTDSDPLKRGSDTCDVYMGTFGGPDEATTRVVHVGDSISDQLAPRMRAAQEAETRRFFIDPQSGQSLGTMRAELRGIASGIRGKLGGASRPDILTIGLGTNDIGMYRSDTFEQEVTEILDGVLADTAEVPCRVLQTVRESEGDRDITDPRARKLQAQRDFNKLVRLRYNADRIGLRLVDWAEIARHHQPVPEAGHENDPAQTPYFGPDAFGRLDRVHPNDIGLQRLLDEWLTQTESCPGA